MNNQNMRTAQACVADTRQAVAEFHAGVTQPGMELVLFFCSSEYDLDVLAEEMNRLFAGVQVVGCTTAGEIGPAGYLQHSLSGASFPS
ncbi:MAG: FIST N-terminal domain-containing protein, partial [Gallionellaceae bacterium]|nr:FIST N-terminal domain-containing protein [Gallionellaceae bacterium]